MSSYHVNELSFEAPDGCVDRSIQLLVGPLRGRGAGSSVVVARDPTEGRGLGELVGLQLDALRKAGIRVGGQREREAGGLEAREARIFAVQDGVPTYGRLLFVVHYDTLLTFTVSSRRAESAHADALSEKLIASLRFRKL